MKKVSERILELAGIDHQETNKERLDEAFDPLLLIPAGMAVALAAAMGHGAWYGWVFGGRNKGLASDIDIAKEKVQGALQSTFGRNPSNADIKKIYDQIKGDHKALEALDSLVSVNGDVDSKSKVEIRKNLKSSLELDGKELGHAEVLITNLIDYHVSKSPKWSNVYAHLAAGDLHNMTRGGTP
jgi:hypothetical protein